MRPQFVGVVDAVGVCGFAVGARPDGLRRSEALTRGGRVVAGGDPRRGTGLRAAGGGTAWMFVAELIGALHRVGEPQVARGVVPLAERIRSSSATGSSATVAS